MGNTMRRIIDAISTKQTELDRLSMLPDALISHILSLTMDTKLAIRTCVLSKRWRDLWTHLPSLYLDNRPVVEGTNDPTSFIKFVDNIILKRKPYKIQTLRFWYSLNERISCDLGIPFLKRVIDYVAKVGVEEELDTNIKKLFRVCCLSGTALRSLKIEGGHCWSRYDHKHNLSEYPALFGSVTRLHLERISLLFEDDSGDLFSRFVNLEELTISRCYYFNAPKFTSQSRPNLVISAPRLKVLNVGLHYVNEEFSLDGCLVLERVNITYKGSIWDNDECRPCVQIIGPHPDLLPFDSKMKMFYKNVIRNIIPKTKLLVVEFIRWKWIFTKCNNNASIEIYVPEIIREWNPFYFPAETWKIEAEFSSTDCVEDDGNGISLIDDFGEVGFSSFPSIIYRSRENIDQKRSREKIDSDGKGNKEKLIHELETISCKNWKYKVTPHIHCREKKNIVTLAPHHEVS